MIDILHSAYDFYASVIVLQRYWTKRTFETKLSFIYQAILMRKTFAFGI